jgi:tetratricopeptide (TPR) repeat protein
MRIAPTAACLLCVGLALTSSLALAQDPPRASPDSAVIPDVKSGKPYLTYREMRRAHDKADRTYRNEDGTCWRITTILYMLGDSDPRSFLFFDWIEQDLCEARNAYEKGRKLDERLARNPSNEKLRIELTAEKAKLREDELMWLSKAIAVLSQDAGAHPDLWDRDAVLLYLGEALWDSGRLEESLATFKELIAKYPRSEYQPDAYLAFGEYYFDQGEPEKALLAYLKVGEFKESPVYPYSVYKRGWCHIRLGELDLARKQFALFARELGALDPNGPDPRLETLRRLAGANARALGQAKDEGKAP